MKQIEVGIIGAGFIGGMRARECANNPLIRRLHVAEIRPERLSEIGAELSEIAGDTKSVHMTADYHDLMRNSAIEAIIVSSTPERTHYTFSKEALLAGKHVFVEKPMAPTLAEADELLDLARGRGLKLTIGYSLRFNPKMAYAKKAIQEKLIGDFVTGYVNRSCTRFFGEKIAGRVNATPTSMVGTHDVDFLLWCLAPRRPVKVYSQTAGRLMRSQFNVPDHQWSIITLDDESVITIGTGWIMPPAHDPFYVHATIELIGTNGMLTIDDSHRDVTLRTREGGTHPMSSQPGERVDHLFVGPLGEETDHFVAAIAYDKPIFVKPDEARMALEVCLAADQSAREGNSVLLQNAANV